MALFKIYKGSEQELKNLKKTKEGNAYYTTDGSHMYVDTATSETDDNARKKVIGLSQINRPFTLSVNWETMSQTISNPPDDTEFFQTNGYTYIVSPSEKSYDAYTEAAIRATEVTDNGITFSCKEIPLVSLDINILRIEEDPYYGQK